MRSITLETRLPDTQIDIGKKEFRRGRRNQHASRVRSPELHLSPFLYGTIANTRAGKPDPPFGLGKLTTTSAPASGT